MRMSILKRPAVFPDFSDGGLVFEKLKEIYSWFFELKIKDKFRYLETSNKVIFL